METTNKKTRLGIGGRLSSKRLLAALAVLAVAFVVLAAVPSVADESDAASATIYVSQSGTQTTLSSATADSLAAFSTVFTTSGLADEVNAGDTIVVIGAVSTTTTTTININKGITIQGQLSGTTKTSSISGYTFKVNDSTASEKVVFKDIVLSDALDSSFISNGTVMTSSGATAAADVTLSNVDITTGAEGRAVAVGIRTTGAVTIENSTFTSTGKFTSSNAREAVQVYRASSLTFTDNTIAGYDRGVNIDGVKTTTASGNTMALVHILDKDTKAYSITRYNDTAFSVPSATISDDPSKITYTVDAKVATTGDKGVYMVVLNDNSGDSAGFTSIGTLTHDFYGIRNQYPV